MTWDYVKLDRILQKAVIMYPLDILSIRREESVTLNGKEY